MSYTLTLDRSEYSVIWLPTGLLVGANVEADLKNDRSRGRWGLHVLARFLIALCICMGAILAWQPDSDAARQIMANSSQLGWLAPPAVPVAQTGADVIAPAVPSPNHQQIKAMPLDFAAVWQSVDQLTASTEQTTREITKLEMTERSVLYKMSNPPPRRVPAHARKHVPRPAPNTTGAGPNGHHAATSSARLGSSSPLPVLFTRLDTGHTRTHSSAAGLRSSAPAAPFSQALKSVLSRITGIRS
jgi:hypothetical protein